MYGISDFYLFYPIQEMYQGDDDINVRKNKT